MPMSAPDFDAALIERYDRAGARYTSYPTAAQFRPDFGETQYRKFAALTAAPCRI